MRRHAFRPAGPDPLEGRLAPVAISPLGNSASQVVHSLSRTSTPTPIYASNADSPSAIAARSAQAARARAAARSTSKSGSIDWNKLGDQVKTFFFGHSKSTHAAAKPATKGLRR